MKSVVVSAGCNAEVVVSQRIDSMHPGMHVASGNLRNVLVIRPRSLQNHSVIVVHSAHLGLG